MQILPDCRIVKQGSSCLWISPELRDQGELDLLSDPDILFPRPDCEIVKDQRKIKVGRLRLEIGGRERGVYLKRYNAFSWRYRFSSLFVPSAAFRSWIGAGILVRAGFHTGRPIAALERRCWGMLTKSFYVSEEIPMAETIDGYWLRELAPRRGREGFSQRREFLRELALLFRSLHQASVYHNDLKDANILFCPRGRGPKGTFYLLDLEGIRRYRRLQRGRRIKNLVQLNRTMGKLLQRTHKLYWLRVYWGPLPNDQREKRWWIKRVLKASARGDLRSMRKESTASSAPGL